VVSHISLKVDTAVSSADLAKAAKFAQDAQTMMDNQLGNIYTDMKTSVVCFQYNTVYTTSYMYHHYRKSKLNIFSGKSYFVDLHWPGLNHKIKNSLNVFNNISVISWWSVLLVEEIGEPGENHRPVASHWQIVSHNVVHLPKIEIRDRWILLVRSFKFICTRYTFLARSFNFTFRYIDNVLSLNNSRFGDFVDRIYPIELEIKDTTDTSNPLSMKSWPDRNHKLWNIVSSERYILHIQVLLECNYIYNGSFLVS
jgi:hypothetical protein